MTFALAAIAFLGLVATPPAEAARPRDGAVVSAPPLLRWAPVRGADFYNVQLYRDGTKILSRWPERARFALHRSWRQNDRRRELSPGRYAWYVWPWKHGRYGRLRVRSLFLYGKLLANEVTPSLTGLPREGSLLEASSGRWSGSKPIAFSIAWRRCAPSGGCVAIPGVGTSSYTAGVADIGSRLQVLVTAANPLGREIARSPLSEPVRALPPRLTGTPQIFGKPRIGQTLSADSGAWESSVPLTYSLRWEACVASSCRPVERAHGRSLVLRQPLLEQAVRVVVTATNSGGSATSMSALSSPVGRTIKGTSGRDRLVGSAGSDSISGRGGDDRIYGGEGPDRIVGGRGRDVIRAGGGNDVVFARDGEHDIVFCGPGDDVAYVDRRDRVDGSCETILRGRV